MQATGDVGQGDIHHRGVENDHELGAEDDRERDAESASASVRGSRGTIATVRAGRSSDLGIGANRVCRCRRRHDFLPFEGALCTAIRAELRGWSWPPWRDRWQPRSLANTAWISYLETEVSSANYTEAASGLQVGFEVHA